MLVGYGVVIGRRCGRRSPPRAASPACWGDRHQRDDAPDGPDPRGAGRRDHEPTGRSNSSRAGLHLLEAPLIALTNEWPGGLTDAPVLTSSVGAGTAGCLLANRLSADPRKPRAAGRAGGGDDDYHWVTSRSATSTASANPRTDWLYATDPDPGLNGRSLRYPRGKVLGGCSSINGMIYMRGQRARLRPLGRARQPGLELGRLPAAVLKHEDHWVPTPSTPRPGFDERRAPRRRVARREAAPALGDPRRLRAGGAAGRHPETDDFNRGDNEAWATSRSTSAPACAGTPPRPSCGRCSRSATTSGLDRRAHPRLLLAHATRGFLGRLAPPASSRGAAAAAAPARRHDGGEVIPPPARSARRRSCSCRASARPACCASTASRSLHELPAWARTCRTTCRSARCSRSTA